MSVPIKPLADYIVSEAEITPSKTASGLYLPDSAKEKPKTAKVLAIGQDVKQIKVGDTILYKSYSITEVKIEAREYILVKEEDVLATVK